MSTVTSNYGFIKPELTDVADITATNPNWDTIDTRLKEVSDYGAKKSTIVKGVTLYASKWTYGVYLWNNNNITSESQIIELMPDPAITTEQLEALQMANIVGTAQVTGAISMLAHGEVPTIDIPVVFIIRGDV